MHDVVILNSDYSYLNIVNWKRAVKLIAKGKVEVVKYSDNIITNFAGTVKMQVPLVIKLINFLKHIYKSRVHFNKKNILIRDKFTCSYCGTTSGRMNVDHVIPVSKGGESSWTNCVCSCMACNGKKSDKDLSQVGLSLRVKPFAPTAMQFLQCKKKIAKFTLDWD